MTDLAMALILEALTHLNVMSNAVSAKRWQNQVYKVNLRCV